MHKPRLGLNYHREIKDETQMNKRRRRTETLTEANTDWRQTTEETGDQNRTGHDQD